MTITTDKVIVPDGTDFTFICKKIPFAISCLSEMPYKEANLVDLDLINKMGITLRDIKVTRMSLLGHDVRAVGKIKQTINCVHKGRVQGTIHLEAKVVRDLYTILGADCIASTRTYSKLMGKKPPDPPDDDLEEEDTQKPILNLGGVDEDEDLEKEDEEGKDKVRKKEEKEDQDDNALKTDENKDEETEKESTAKKEEDKPKSEEEEVEAAFCDEDQSEHNLSLATHIAYLKWKSVPEPIRGIEISAFSHGYNVSSDTAFHHAQAEEEHERQHQPQVLQWVDSEEETEEDDDAPLQPVDCNTEAPMFCRTCFMFKKPETIWRSHHSGQMLACPTIPIEVKRDLVNKYKKGEI